MKVEADPKVPFAHAREGVRVYVPGRQRELGLRVWAEMGRELVGARFLIWRAPKLFERSLRLLFGPQLRMSRSLSWRRSCSLSIVGRLLR